MITMTLTFRKFLEEDMTAVPAGGAMPSAPMSPDNKKSDISVGDREFGISPTERDTIDVDGEFITSHQPLKIPGHGIYASAPISLQILKKYGDGSAEVKVMYSLANKEKLQNPNGSKYSGPIEDKETYMPKRMLDNIRLKPFDNQGAGGVPPVPGGPPGMPMPGAM